MSAEPRRVRTYCSLCAVACPAVITATGDDVVSLEPDAEHPSGGSVCVKGRAAPEMHKHPDRVDYPLRRTRPKGDADPGWVRCSWDEALDLIATKMLAIKAESGAHAVAFSKGTSGATGLRETESWLQRLVHHFGSPNMVSTTHLCQWPRDTGAAYYVFGVRGVMPIPHVWSSNCVLLWGTNPNATNLSLAQNTAKAKGRGTKLVVVDPRRIGLANKADVHLAPRPGTDGALALAMIDVLLREERYDAEFARRWTNGPLLVRTDTNRLLRAAEVAHPALAAATPDTFVATDGTGLVAYDPATGYAIDPGGLAIRATVTVPLQGGGAVSCRTVLDLLAAEAATCRPEVAAEITGVAAPDIVAAARLLAENRPVSHYFFNGIVQHTNATQTARAIGVLYALLGDFDAQGGNVIGGPLNVNEVAARDALPVAVAALRLGRDERPLGPPGINGAVAAYDLYGAILDGRPYPVRALVTFGNNLLLANGDTLRGRKALERLEFFAVVELFHTPTSAYADVVLPAADFMEAEALNVSRAGTVRRRPAVVPPLHERRSDVRIVFDLAGRLGLGEHFWEGDVEAGYDHVLAPAGLTWRGLADEPVDVSIRKGPPQYRKYAEIDAATGRPRGFGTPTRMVELWSEAFAGAGLPGLPTFEEPAQSPRSTPELARRFPIVLTNAKRPHYLHSQHRGLPYLRKIAPDPIAEIGAATAAAYGIASGDWVVVETPSGRARFRADVTDALIEGVVCIEHGWWQACEELGLPGFDPYTDAGANPNLLVHNELHDPVSGGTPHRSSLCRITRADDAADTARADREPAAT